MNQEVQTFMLKDDGLLPNNPTLPVIVYKGVFKNHPADIETTFNRHNWTGSWTGGVYEYHHYHTNTHEVLGVKAGNATVLIGGGKGKHFELHKGDVIVLPAGTGHKKLESSADFEVVGAYPDGRSPNMYKSDPEERVKALAEIRNVPVPDFDPVYGEDGPLLGKWRK
ncbi:cupin domain-containing protein [Bacillus sp. ISL-47]|uniref:cupin domain-containing protein n=1 Tax=Bacillus sp. ISL-47 TaxID=2819130 RepID=UPI001BEB93E8|nr:cupin domain-containing protein [Bacillus sp. ISL-47]MBT2687310.1 cupin domain-containing protein [Bacillus sp. ISL-47]MBT2706620.1 cupin domain-containing protein [Pseudomonas sp. ISL-84]